MASLNQKKCARFCNSWIFTVFSFDHISVENGKKKFVGLPNNWNNLTGLNIHEGHEAFGIVTGKKSGITVIDCDTENAYADVIRDFPELLETITVKTYRGYHIYTIYNPNILNGSNVFEKYPGVDIRNDGGFVVAPYSSYEINGNIFTYSVDGTGLCNYPVGLNPKKQDGKIKVTPKLSEQIIDLCDIIDVKYLDNRADWFKIIMALRSIGANKDFLRNLSMKSNHFTEDGLNSAYDAYDPKKSSKILFGIPNTLRYYARSSDKDKYIEIMNKHIKFNGSNDCDIVETIEKLFSGTIIFNNGFFVFNGKYWRKDRDNSAITKIIKEDLCEYYKLCFEVANDETKKHINRVIKKCRNDSGISSIIKQSKAHFSMPDIKFENNPNIFCFNDKIYDFKNDCWIDHTDYDDFMYLTTGYDYREPSETERLEIWKIICTIFPDEKIRECYLDILGTAMVGKNPELFIMAEGSGGNGKGLIHGFVSTMLGNYYRPLDVNVILNELKLGANPAIASLNDCRLAICREPAEGREFCFATIKALTGGDELAGRDLYSSNMNINIPMTLILECNEKPSIASTIGNDIKRRLVDIRFSSTFTDDPKLLTLPGHFPINTNLKDTKFKDNHRFALFEILRPYAVKYANSGTIEIPPVVRNETITYFAKSNPVVEWFTENYERDEHSYEKIIDIANHFRKECVHSSHDIKKYSSRNKVMKYITIEGLVITSTTPQSLLGWRRKMAEAEQQLPYSL